MDETRLRQIFPRASRSFFEANRALLRSAKPQRLDEKARPLGAVRKGKDKSSQRIGVRICSYRCRPVDPDNLAGGCKALLDALHAGQVIPDDNPETITLTVEQRKVS